MKSHYDRFVKFRATLITSLFLIALLATGLSLSCYAPASAPPAATPERPKTPTPGTSSTTPSPIEVVIEGFAFKPAEITIPLDGTIIWHNKDSAPHTVTSRDNSFDSGRLSRDGSFRYTFKQKGAFEYYCGFHPSMRGKVIVE